MKKFTCRELGGVCDAAFEGATYREVGEKGGAHIMSTTDKAHAKLREQLATSSKAEKQQWWDWFKGEWNKKIIIKESKNYGESTIKTMASTRVENNGGVRIF